MQSIKGRFSADEYNLLLFLLGLKDINKVTQENEKLKKENEELRFKLDKYTKCTCDNMKDNDKTISCPKCKEKHSFNCISTTGKWWCKGCNEKEKMNSK